MLIKKVTQNGEHTLTTVAADSKIQTLPVEIPEAKKVVVIT